MLVEMWGGGGYNRNEQRIIEDYPLLLNIKKEVFL